VDNASKRAVMLSNSRVSWVALLSNWRTSRQDCASSEFIPTLESRAQVSEWVLKRTASASLHTVKTLLMLVLFSSGSPDDYDLPKRDSITAANDPTSGSHLSYDTTREASTFLLPWTL